jgi:hypothetical protein
LWREACFQYLSELRSYEENAFTYDSENGAQLPLPFNNFHTIPDSIETPDGFDEIRGRGISRGRKKMTNFPTVKIRICIWAKILLLLIQL